MKRPTIVTVTLLVIIALVNPISAKEKDRTLILKFVPQESTGAESPTLSRAMTEKPVMLLVSDERPVSEASIVGDGTGDDDETFDWHAENDVGTFATDVINQVLSEWGVRITSDAALSLEVRLNQFRVSERDQAVGSMYGGAVRITYELRRQDGTLLATGASAGDARRYGRKRKGENCVEVLSDAMKESLARLASDTSLQKAWRTNQPIQELRQTAEAISPSELLEELVRLHEQGVKAELLIRYVQQKSVSSQFEAKDLVQWTESGLPDEVISAALEQVRKGETKDDVPE